MAIGRHAPAPRERTTETPTIERASRWSSGDKFLWKFSKLSKKLVQIAIAILMVLILFTLYLVLQERSDRKSQVNNTFCILLNLVPPGIKEVDAIKKQLHCPPPDRKIGPLVTPTGAPSSTTSNAPKGIGQPNPSPAASWPNFTTGAFPSTTPSAVPSNSNSLTGGNSATHQNSNPSTPSITITPTPAPTTNSTPKPSPLVSTLCKLLNVCSV